MKKNFRPISSATPRSSTLLRFSNRSSFTLIELLVVVAIIAILSVFVIITINPAELLKQARDSQRVSDIATINSALNLYQVDNVTGSLGTASTTYISIPDNTATSTAGTQCQGLSLPALPTGWTYHCAASSTYKSANGTGWIPVNFTSISYGSPLGSLPADPINSTTTAFYTYTPGGSWQLTAIPESQKTRTNTSQTNPITGAITQGSDLTLSPLFNSSGLVGYWKFDEGTGATSTDSSGSRSDGSWVGTPGYASGKVGQYAGSFNGSSNYSSTNTAIPSSNFSFSFWFFLNRDSISRGCGQQFLNTNSWTLYQHSANDYPYFGTGGARYIYWQPSANAWHNLACSITSSGSNGGPDWQGICYGDGVSKVINQSGYLSASTNLYIGGNSACSLGGLIDDLRIYNRALSAAEIVALYNATK